MTKRGATTTDMKVAVREGHCLQSGKSQDLLVGMLMTQHREREGSMSTAKKPKRAKKAKKATADVVMSQSIAEQLDVTPALAQKLVERVGHLATEMTEFRPVLKAMASELKTRRRAARRAIAVAVVKGAAGVVVGSARVAASTIAAPFKAVGRFAFRRKAAVVAAD